MKYTLPIYFLDNKYHAVKLDLNESEENFPFVVPVKEGYISLFRIISDKLIGFTEADDLLVKLTKLSYENAILTLSFSSDGLSPADDLDILEIAKVEKHKKNQNSVKFKTTNPLTKICFEFQKGALTHTGSINVNLAPPDSIFDIVLDFGSEASQMLINNNNRTLERRKIVSDIRKNFYSAIGIQEELHQTDTDEELYRSFFFVKKENSIFNLTDAPNTNGDDELLPFLTKVDQHDILSRYYRLISNLKLANMGVYNFQITFADPSTNTFGVRTIDFQTITQELQQKILNGFILSALNIIKDATPENFEKNIRVRLLVPNVLEQVRVSAIIKNTAAFLSTQANDYIIKGIQVATISESDASFLGYWWERDNKNFKNRRLPNTRNLVIDMGKGTTDFSVIDSDANGELSSEFRSGFVGAGNVITYAFIETIFTIIFGDNVVSKQKALNKFLLNEAVAFQLSFLNKIETIKANFIIDNTGLKNVREIDNTLMSDRVKELLKTNDLSDGIIEDSQINELLDLIINTQKTIKDEFGYIGDAVGALVNQIKVTTILFLQGEKKARNIDKMLLTGRSFLFKPLVDSLKSYFQHENMSVELLTRDRDKTILKKICLEGAYREMIINKDSNLVGFPITNFALSEEIGRKRIENVVEINDFKNNKIHINDVKSLSFKDWLKKFGVIAKSFSLESLDVTQEKPFSDTPSTKNEEVAIDKAEYIDRTEEIITGTLNLGHYNSMLDSIYVSGVFYNVPNSKGNFKLFYDGESIYLRNESERLELQAEKTFKRGDEFGFRFKTLFPFCSVHNTNEIIVRASANDDFIL